MKKKNNIPEKENTVKNEKSTATSAREVSPRKKHIVVAAVFTALFIAAAVVLNIIIGILSDRFGLKADLTAEGLYSLDSQTEYYLDYFLNTDISLTVTSSEKRFNEGGDYFKQVDEILKKLSAYSSHITLDFLDLEQNPDFAAKFDDLTEFCVVVENKNSGRYRIITPNDYFGLTTEEAWEYYYYYGYIAGSYIEQETVSAMLYVSDDDPAKVVFTEGYGEHGSDALSDLLKKNGYEVETVNILTGEIPEDADVVVVYAPTSDYGAGQLAKLDKFLDNGGNFGKNVFYFASSEQKETPNIEGFLNDWGLSVGYSVIGQKNLDYLFKLPGQEKLSYYNHLQYIKDTEFTQDAFGMIMFGADMRPVYTLSGTSNQLDVLLGSFKNSFLYPLDLKENEKFDLSTAETGIYNDVVMSTKTVSDSVSRVCAAGSDTLAGKTLMSYSNAGNQLFFLGIFDGMCGRNTGISITPKSFDAVTFEMNATTANVLGVILCIVIPVLIITAGIVIYVRRRHR